MLPDIILWRAIKPLYLVCDSENYLFITSRKHSINDDYLLCILTDRAAYVPDFTKQLAASPLYLHDTLMCGDGAFWKLTGKIEEQL